MNPPSLCAAEAARTLAIARENLAYEQAVVGPNAPVERDELLRAELNAKLAELESNFTSTLNEVKRCIDNALGAKKRPAAASGDAELSKRLKAAEPGLVLPSAFAISEKPNCIQFYRDQIVVPIIETLCKFSESLPSPARHRRLVFIQSLAEYVTLTKPNIVRCTAHTSACVMRGQEAHHFLRVPSGGAIDGHYISYDCEFKLNTLYAACHALRRYDYAAHQADSDDNPVALAYFLEVFTVADARVHRLERF